MTIYLPVEEMSHHLIVKEYCVKDILKEVMWEMFLINEEANYLGFPFYSRSNTLSKPFFGRSLHGTSVAAVHNLYRIVMWSVNLIELVISLPRGHELEPHNKRRGKLFQLYYKHKNVT